MIRRETRPIRRSDLRCHTVDEEVLVYDSTRRSTHRLNSTARFIWEHCDGQATCADIAAEMTSVWAVDVQRADADVHAAIEQMLRQGLVELPGGSRS